MSAPHHGSQLTEAARQLSDTIGDLPVADRPHWLNELADTIQVIADIVRAARNNPNTLIDANTAVNDLTKAAESLRRLADHEAHP